MFISHIVIENMFAYYGKVEVDFYPQEGKNIFCIFGENGYGKTSFIQCAKLLFLGTGLIEDSQVPEVISRFSGNKIKQPSTFILGNGNWRGILNDKAVRLQESDYSISFSGNIKDQVFQIKRSWSKQGNNIEENLNLILDHQTLTNTEAQERINTILPPNFVEFFFFDGEEIERIGDNLKTKLKDKILDFLKISPLERIIKESEQLKYELIQKAIENKREQDQYAQKNLELKILKDNLQRSEDYIASLSEDIQEKENQRANKENKKAKIEKDESETIEKLYMQRNELESTLTQQKKTLLDTLKKVIFLSNTDLLTKLQTHITDFENQINHTDLEAITRMLPHIKTIFQNKLNDDNLDQILEILECLPNELKQSIISSDFQIPYDKLFTIQQTIHSLKTTKLHQEIRQIRESKLELEDITDQLKFAREDLQAKERVQKLEEEILELKTSIQTYQDQLEEEKSKKTECKIKIENLEKEMMYLNQNINTERIEREQLLLDCIIASIKSYKERLIEILRIELRDKILHHYKSLLHNDNIASLEISEDFEIVLRDHTQKEIYTGNQSSGQRQILAISIFWALKDIAKSEMPLIIDTPLSRIDSKNRKNIITQYYAKASHQVIVLPHDAEIGEREYDYAKSHIAEIYKIENSINRNEAKIKECSFDDI